MMDSVVGYQAITPYMFLSNTQLSPHTVLHSPVESFPLKRYECPKPKESLDLAINPEKEDAGLPMKTFERIPRVISPPNQELDWLGVWIRWLSSGSAFNLSNTEGSWPSDIKTMG